MITTHINDFLLDPNNYRFIDKPEYNKVPDEQISDDKVQQRTFSFIVGKNNENIDDLILSFKTNGFLDIDQIQVKAIGNKYRVLEGNRRIATLKFLYKIKEKEDVGKLTENDFEHVNAVEVKSEDQTQHLITMGLHHISGKKRWSAVNEAQLLEDLRKRNMSEEEICNSLGINKQKLRLGLRTLSFINQYKKSDYGDQFKTDMYYIFQSIIKSPAMKKWIGWDDSRYEAMDQDNRERFFSWISRTEEVERNDDTGEEHIATKEPIISQYRQINELEEFINDKKAIEQMEKKQSIKEGYKLSDALEKTKFRNAINNIKNNAETISLFHKYMTNEDVSEISKLKDNLDVLTFTNLAVIKNSETNAEKYFQSINKHFEQINIKRCRKLYDIDIKYLKRINIFAGGNNLGKTSILESCYLLSRLNDITALIEIEKYRGKFYNEFKSEWFNENIKDSIEIAGTFNSTSSKILIQNEKSTENIGKTGYLSTVKIEAQVNETVLESSIHLYNDKEQDMRFVKTQKLCQSSFTSPYRYNIDLLSKAHSYAVKENYYDDIVNFIRENMDSSIEKITLIKDNRFMVASSKLDTAIDITKYGEGMQRVFEIALLMGYNQNGILCIDEFDCAIHNSLLVKFSKFIQQLAEKFNVQVFLSTHSKECIDAFIGVKYNGNKDITAYKLMEEDGKVVCKYVNGERLESLIQSINFDIR